MRTDLPPCSFLGVATGFGLLQLRQWARLAGRPLGLGRPRPLDPAAWSAPDSALATRARALAVESYDAHLLGHVERTWAFAVAVADHLDLSPDPEALYVACLLHDLGLTARFPGEAPFELRGADAAHALCLPDRVRAEPDRTTLFASGDGGGRDGAPRRPGADDNGASDAEKERDETGARARIADVVHEAIALHTSLSAALGSAEVRLVQAGSGGDLVGLDSELVHPETRRHIERRWPITPSFAGHVTDALQRETAPHPTSPGARLLQVGFASRAEAYQRRRLDRLAR